MALPHNLQQLESKKGQSGQIQSVINGSLIKSLTVLDEFKYEIPSNGLSVAPNKWWGSGGPGDFDYIDARETGRECRLKCEDVADDGSYAEKKPEGEKENSNATLRGASLLTAVRKGALEEGREALKLGVFRSHHAHRVEGEWRENGWSHRMEVIEVPFGATWFRLPCEHLGLRQPGDYLLTQFRIWPIRFVSEISFCMLDYPLNTVGVHTLKMVFHGIDINKEEVILEGSEAPFRIDAEALLAPEELAPVASLDKMRVPYRPVAAKLRALPSSRDKLPAGKRISALRLTYKFKSEDMTPSSSRSSI